MTRPKRPGYRTCWLIYETLATGDRSFKQLKQITKLHDKTLTDSLIYLEKRKLVEKIQPIPKKYKGMGTCFVEVKEGEAIVERREEEIQVGDARERIYRLLPTSERLIFLARGKELQSWFQIPGEGGWLPVLIRPSKTGQQKIRRWQKSGKFDRIREHVEKQRIRPPLTEVIDSLKRKYDEEYGELVKIFPDFEVEVWLPKLLARGNPIVVEREIAGDFERALRLHRQGFLCLDCFKKGRKFCRCRRPMSKEGRAPFGKGKARHSS